MLIAIDIGNSGITFGVFDNETIRETFWLKSDINMSKIEYKTLIATHCQNYKIDKCIICSVYEELTEKIKTVVSKTFNITPFVLNKDAKLNIKLATEKNQTIGSDRIANAAGAFHKYKKACIVIDIGTATTFDIVNSKGEFTGGIIMPGIKMQLEALNLKTSKLPLVEISYPKNAIGKTTEQSILSGVVLGHAKAISGLLKKVTEELNEPAQIILTGGFAKNLSEYIDCKTIDILPYLTLEGLRIIYNFNA